MISIKYIKSSNDTRKKCDIVTFSDESDEDEDNDQAHSIIWKNNTMSKCDAKQKNIDVIMKSIMMNSGKVLYGFLSDIGFVTNEKERAVLNYGGQRVTLHSLKTLTGTKWLNDEVFNFYHHVVLSE